MTSREKDERKIVGEREREEVEEEPQNMLELFKIRLLYHLLFHGRQFVENGLSPCRAN